MMILGREKENAQQLLLRIAPELKTLLLARNHSNAQTGQDCKNKVENVV